MDKAVRAYADWEISWHNGLMNWWAAHPATWVGVTVILLVIYIGLSIVSWRHRRGY